MLKGLLLGITGDYFHLGLCAAPQSIHCLKRAILPPLTGCAFQAGGFNSRWVGLLSPQPQLCT